MFIIVFGILSFVAIIVFLRYLNERKDRKVLDRLAQLELEEKNADAAMARAERS